MAKTVSFDICGLLFRGVAMRDARGAGPLISEESIIDLEFWSIVSSPSRRLVESDLPEFAGGCILPLSSKVLGVR